MAAPVFRSAGASVLSDGMTITSPSDVVVGDLLLFFCWSQGTTIPTHTLQTGFTEVRTHAHNDGTTDGRLSLASKLAVTAGAQSYTPYTTNGVAGQNNICMLVIKNGTWNGTLSGWAQNSVTQTNNAVPNPGSVTGLNGDHLVIACAAWHITTAGTTAATPPTNYIERTDGPGGSHVTHLSAATRALVNLVAATEDPAAFGDNVAPNGTASITVSIPNAGTDMSPDQTLGNRSVGRIVAAGIALAGALAFAGLNQTRILETAVEVPVVVEDAYYPPQSSAPPTAIWTGSIQRVGALIVGWLNQQRITEAPAVTPPVAEETWPQQGNAPPASAYVAARVAAAVAVARSQQRITEAPTTEVVVVTRRVQVSWAEMEVPLAPRRAQVSWSELEVPLAPRRAQVSWSELEVPLSPRRAQVSWSELEVPLAPRRAQVSWAEMQVPNVMAGGPGGPHGHRSMRMSHTMRMG